MVSGNFNYGNFNYVLDPSVYSSKSTSHLSFATHKCIKKCFNLHQLVDVWRIQHPSTKDYLHYSSTHNTYMRINFFLIKHALYCHTLQYGDLTFSTHASIDNKLTIGMPTSSAWSWRLTRPQCSHRISHSPAPLFHLQL